MLIIIPSVVVKTASVNICIPVAHKPSHVMMSALQGQCVTDMKESKPTGAELSGVLYAFYQFVEFAINGTPGNAKKSKVAAIACSLQGNDFIITVSGATNPTVALKGISFVLKGAAAVSRMKSLYKKNMDMFGLKTVDADFKAAADTVSAGCKHMKIAIVGIKIPSEKEKIISGKIAAAIAALPAGAAGKVIPGIAEPALDPYIKGAKFDCLIAKLFLAEQKIDSNLIDNGLVPRMLPRFWVTAAGKFAPKFEKYIDQKLLSQAEKLGDILRIQASHMGCFTPAEIHTIADTPSKADLHKALKSMLGS